METNGFLINVFILRLIELLQIPARKALNVSFLASSLHDPLFERDKTENSSLHDPLFEGDKTENSFQNLPILSKTKISCLSLVLKFQCTDT